MKIGKYEIKEQLDQNRFCLYEWVEAIDTHQGHPVMLQIFQPKLPSEAQSAILAYFDDLQAIRRQPIWSPVQSFSNTDSSLIFAYPFLHTISLLQVDYLRNDITMEMEGDDEDSILLLHRMLNQAAEEEPLKWLKQASEALHILHNANLVHGHVTLDSFVIAEQNLYLTDFGYAPLLQLGYPEDIVKTCCPISLPPRERFLAPEVVEKRQLTPAADIYAFAKAVTKFYPQLTETSWYSQATHPNPDNRFQRIRPCFAALEKAFPSVNSIIVPKYLLETRVEPPESGKIIKNNTSFLADKVATVLAKPASGWQFDHWSGDINDVNNPLKLKIDGDKTLVANFNPVTQPTQTQTQPQAQTWRCTQTLIGHNASVRCVAISSDSQILVSGSEDRTIKLWHLGNVNLIRTLNWKGAFGESEASWVNSLAISPNGQTLASSNLSKFVKLWDCKSGKLIRNFRGHSDTVHAIALSSDGQTLVSGSRDNTIKAWNLTTEKFINTFKGHSNSVLAVAISPDGKTLVSGSRDNTINIWDVPSGKLLRTLRGHSDWVRTVAISRDGKLFASGSSDQTVQLWDLDNGALLRTLNGHSDWVNSVVISPDCNTLISGSKDTTIKLWQIQSGQLICTLTDHLKPVCSVAISPDGRTIASSSEGGAIKIWTKT
jgi:WD40 repeat protein